MRSCATPQIISKEEDNLEWWSTLPFEYRNLQISYGSRPVGFRFSKYIVNIKGCFQSEDINSCGEADTRELAMTKAIAELIERTSMLKWSQENDDNFIKTSNGWAAHQTINEVKKNAIYELAERDAVLNQWYLRKPFFEIDVETLPIEFKNWMAEELALSEYPIMKLLLSTEGLGPSVTCIFMNSNGFGVSSHSSGSDIKASIKTAIAETCRSAHLTLRRSFWKDSLNLKDNNARNRVAPGAHAVYYSYHEPFPKWMFGAVKTWSQANQYWKNRTDHFENEVWSDFRFQTICTEPLYVGYATHPECLELTWGVPTPQLILEITANKRFAGLLSEGTINTKPHIIS